MKKSGKKAAKALKKDVKAGKKERKIAKTLLEFKDKDLHVGSKKGPLVTNKRQALAIALSEGKKAANGKRKPKSKKKK